MGAFLSVNEKEAYQLFSFPGKVVKPFLSFDFVGEATDLEKGIL